MAPLSRTYNKFNDNNNVYLRLHLMLRNEEIRAWAWYLCLCLYVCIHRYVCDILAVLLYIMKYGFEYLWKTMPMSEEENKLSMVIIKCCFQWYVRFTAQLYKWTRKEEFFIAYFSAPYAWHFLNIESSRRNNKRWCTRIRTIVTRFSTSIFIDLGAKVPHKKMRSKYKTLL